MVFHGGPADEIEIETSVEPLKRRWFVQQKGSKVSWWTFEPPPSDPDVEVTLYNLMLVEGDLQANSAIATYEPDSQYEG
jgi:hypothetical protein